jgi:aconitate hydratase
LAGRVDIDLTRDPLGRDADGREVYLREIWPSLSEVRDAMASALSPEVFRRLYSDFAGQNPKWNEIPGTAGVVYEWDEKSDYIHEPPYFTGFSLEVGTIGNIVGARPLGIFGDSVTTDHISPAGAIKQTSPAGQYLISRGVKPADFNSYGSRRGNDLVMTRGTFANVRIKNLMVPGVEGGVTIYYPDKEQLAIYDAAVRYRQSGVPLVVIAGQEYGTGSSRDWAAKGTLLLGVKAVIAQSFERIHRSNLVGMGVLPLQFVDDTNAQSLGLDGSEVYHIKGLSNDIRPRQKLPLTIERQDGRSETIEVILRIDTPIEVDYYRQGGILPYVLRGLVGVEPGGHA